MKSIQEGAITLKLPGTGTSIFAVMSQAAAEHGALNLSQGFPDFEVSQDLVDRIHFYMKKGMNQYAPMTGIPRLRQRISEKTLRLHGVLYDPEKEINIVAGATQGIFTTIMSMIHKGDEVIIFEPAYDSYAPSVSLSGGVVRRVQLTFPEYRIPWDQVRELINPATRMLIINSPHNPSGSTLEEDDMQELIGLTRNSNILILSDEVYEHLIFDGKKHLSVSRYPELASRSFVMGSFGKTYHATGWKMGYVLAPAALMKEFRKSHQFIVFTCNTPVQWAIADFLGDPSTYENLGAFYQEKRDHFAKKISSSRFRIIPSHGTYFQLLDFSGISDMNDLDFALFMTKNHKIASIPVTPFYENPPDLKVLRFCFAKKEETLNQAAEILCRI